MEKWPNLFIVGAPKGGTTSIHAYLSMIPEIYMSQIKEPNFFSANTVSINHPVKPIRDAKKYLELFKNARYEKYLGEASPSYLADPEAPKLIHELSPDAKIIISLRDPIERVFSHYLMYIRDGWWDHSFKEQIEKEFKKNIHSADRIMELNTSFYYENVKRYLEIFGPNQVKIIIFEDFVKEPKETLQEILKFLDIENSFIDFDPEKFNPYIEVRGQLRKSIRRNETLAKLVKLLVPKSLRLYMRHKIFIRDAPKPIMDFSDREFLIHLYRSDVEKIKSLLGIILPWNNFSKPVDEKIGKS